MKTIVILYPTEQRNDAEHAMGVLEEELDAHRVWHHSVGKEIIQTQTARFVFRDIYEPTKQNAIRKVDSLYVSQSILHTEEVKAYDEADKKDWLSKPTGGVIAYIQEIESEINREKVARYEVETDGVKKVWVEQYRADRSGYFPTEEAAMVLFEKQEEYRRRQQAEEQANAESKRKNRRKPKKQTPEPSFEVEVEPEQLSFV